MANQITYDQLKKTFDFGAASGTSRLALLVQYHDNGQTRGMIGFPYEVDKGAIEIGPYAKNTFSSIPKDYHERKKKIPINDIIDFKIISI